MDKTEIDRIIIEGTVKEKIVLYFTAVAYYNTGLGDLSLLTEEEQTYLYLCIKEPKDLKYYNEIRTYNKAFILFKERYIATKNEFLRVQETMYRYKAVNTIKTQFLQAINMMLIEIKDNHTQKKTAETGAKILRQWGLLSSVSAEENEYKKFRIATPELFDNIALEETIEVFNASAQACKEYIQALKTLKKFLPLPPYGEFIKLEEKLLRKITLDWAIYDKVITYNDIEVEITEEDRATILEQRHL